MKPSRAAQADLARQRVEQRAAELSGLFAEAGWEPSVENFEPREFVKWLGTPDGGWWVAAGTPKNKTNRAKACRTEEEVLAFLADGNAEEPKRKASAPESAAAPAEPPEPQVVERVIPDPTDKALIDTLRAENEALKAREPEIKIVERVVEKIVEAQHTLQSRPDTPDGGYEYGTPDEVITEVEPEPGGLGSDPRPRLIASDWLKGQMKPGESLAQARNRLLQEYNDLLNRNVTASFANDAERIRFRDLTANMTDFSKG